MIFVMPTGFERLAQDTHDDYLFVQPQIKTEMSSSRKGEEYLDLWMYWEKGKNNRTSFSFIIIEEISRLLKRIACLS